GSVNAAGLALWGVNLDGVLVLQQVYQAMADTDLMDSHLERLALRALSGRPNHDASRRVRDFMIAAGLSSDLRFDQIKNVRLGLVCVDLNTSRTLIYGEDPTQSVLDGLMASIAIPPWFAPVEVEGRYIVDAGAVSNLPIESAIKLGATEIIALDLNDPASWMGNVRGSNQIANKLAFTVIQRQSYIETAFAEAQGVPVDCVALRSSPPAPIWDFNAYKDLIETGYEIASRTISDWHKTGRSEPAY
ncbi:MAG TPA: patatin-like phospholipase family protein, partial [Anaerolineales bacterium]